MNSSKASIREALTGSNDKSKVPPVADGILSITPDTPEVVEWRSRSALDTAETSSPYLDDEFDDGPRPHELYGKFTWKIENFSETSKRELRSNIFDVGNYKWYILVYPQGCDVCNHLSLFLCVADYDKLLPGWSHFAQFTIAVVNKDPKKSKYSDTLHRFCKKEHDWGWKKFMELSKVLDGFTVADTLVIKAQVQVILDRPSRPFRCLDPQYRRELVRVYLTNVEGVCRRFCEDKRLRLMWAKEETGKFKDFWRSINPEQQRKLLAEKGEVICKGVVKQFFNEKEVTSTLVMDALYSGCKQIEEHSRNYMEGKPVDSPPMVLIKADKNMIALHGDLMDIAEHACRDFIPAAKDDNVMVQSNDGLALRSGQEDDYRRDSIERDEKRLAELGRKTVEMYVLSHIFSERLEIAYREAEALKRQDLLIAEEFEQQRLVESKQKAQAEKDKEKKAKKKERAKAKKDAEKAKKEAEEAEKKRIEEAKQAEQGRKAREAATNEKRRQEEEAARLLAQQQAAAAKQQLQRAERQAAAAAAAAAAALPEAEAPPAPRTTRSANKATASTATPQQQSPSNTASVHPHRQPCSAQAQHSGSKPSQGSQQHAHGASQQPSSPYMQPPTPPPPSTSQPQRSHSGTDDNYRSRNSAQHVRSEHQPDDLAVDSRAMRIRMSEDTSVGSSSSQAKPPPPPPPQQHRPGVASHAQGHSGLPNGYAIPHGGYKGPGMGSHASSRASSVDREMLGELMASGSSAGDHGIGPSGPGSSERQAVDGKDHSAGPTGGQGKGGMHVGRDSAPTHVRSISGLDAQTTVKQQQQQAVRAGGPMHGGQRQGSLNSQQQHAMKQGGAAASMPHGMGQDGFGAMASSASGRPPSVGDPSGVQQPFPHHSAMMAAAGAAAQPNVHAVEKTTTSGFDPAGQRGAGIAVAAGSFASSHAMPGPGSVGSDSMMGHGDASLLQSREHGASSNNGPVDAYGLASYRNAAAGLPGAPLTSSQLASMVSSAAVNGMPSSAAPPTPPNPSLSPGPHTKKAGEDPSRAPLGGSPPAGVRGPGHLNHAAAEFTARHPLMSMQQQQHQNPAPGGMNFNAVQSKNPQQRQHHQAVDCPGLDDFAHMGLIDDLLTD